MFCPVDLWNVLSSSLEKKWKCCDLTHGVEFYGMSLDQGIATTLTTPGVAKGNDPESIYAAMSDPVVSEVFKGLSKINGCP